MKVAGVAVMAGLLALVLPGSALAGGPGVWTKIDTVDNGFDTAGMLRTADGSLHLVWLKKRLSNSHESYGTATISLAGKLLSTGTIAPVSNWDTLEPDPRLVKDGSGLRLIFNGNTGTSGCYAAGEIFTATSANGSAWTLVHGSMDSHTAGVGNIAATTELNGTPVATFAAGALFHVGVDPNCPASTLDSTIPVATGNSPSNPSIVTASDGSVWVATFQAFSKEGYFVDQILPTEGPLTEAPDSQSTAAHNNQPNDPVALAAPAGGGVYMAYCVANSSQPCVHIDLWKVGTAKPMIVPGSANINAGRVALAAAPGGRLAVVWYDGTKNLIHAVRTNTSATAFGVVRSIKLPSGIPSSNVSSVQAEDSSGRLDVVIVGQATTSGFPISVFHTQILPGLTLAASPHSFSHTKKTTVTFTVTDAGQAVAGANVSCLRKSGKTSAAGRVALTFPKGTATGRHVCTARKPGYNAGKVTIKVT